jgi:hypothetical protein
MLGSAASTYINYRKYLREEDLRQEDLDARFLEAADKLRALGDRLLYVISLTSDNGEAAFKLIQRSPDIAESAGLTLRSGETSIALAPDGRRNWDGLVSKASQTATLMNEGIMSYEEALWAILSIGRSLERVVGVSLESVISVVVDESVKFRKAADSYQNLRAGSPLDEAQLRFERLRLAAWSLVQTANGFVDVSLAIRKATHRQK